MRSTPLQSAAVAVILALGAANATSHTAFARGVSGGVHFVGRGFAGHRFAMSHGFAGRRFFVSRGFAHAFRGDFAVGGLWPYYYAIPNNQDGDVNATAYARTVDAAPEPLAVHACRRSEETVKVPAERGGTSLIKIINCPYGR